MLDKIGSFTKRIQIGLILAVSSALTFNNWLLAPLLNRELFSKNGAVSEFSAVTQPHYWVFRMLDVISGLLFITLALWLITYFENNDRLRNVVVIGMIVLGIANIVDASFSLQCSETLNVGCNIPVDLSLSNFHLPSHAYSSVVIAVCYLLLPTASLLYAVRNKIANLMTFSALLSAVALQSFLSAIIHYMIYHSFSVKPLGSSQEVQMLLFGVWFVYLTWTLSRGEKYSYEI